MKSPVIRPAQRFDVEEIVKIGERPFAAHWSRQAYADEISRRDSIFLVADDGGTRGYLVARCDHDRLDLLDIAAGEDGRGIGRALWTALIAAARSRGAATIALEVSDANTRAKLFYARAGAKVVGRRPKFYNDGSDAILMDYPLS